jgi:hypothetical protein
MTCQPSEPIKTRTGRPREHDRDQIASELIEWARKDNSINLNAFCCTREPPLDPSKLSNWAKEDDYFRQVFKATKTFLAVRREQWVSSEQLHQSAYSRTSKVYDHFEKEEARDEFAYQKELEAKVGKEINASANEDVKTRLDATLNQLSELQSSLNKAKSKINNELKS